MKKFRNYLPIAFAAMALFATSCDDKNDPEPAQGSENTESGEVNPSQVFTQGLPTQVGDYVITTDGEGRVAKIVDGDEVTTFNYNPTRAISIPTDYDMTMNVEWGNDEDSMDFYIKLNKQGFIEYAYEVEKDKIDGDTAEEWWFTYNDAGQLIEMKRTEGDNEITTISYDDKGNITSVKVADDDSPEGKMECTVAYTSTAFPTGIANKSGIMLYDETFCIDMDEMAPAYYAGLLGKGTTQLPLSAFETNGDYPTNYTFSWELNANDMPIALTISYSYKPSWSDETFTSTEEPIFLKW